MSNFGYQRQQSGGITLANNEAIPFNSPLVNYDNSITYNDDGTFTFSAAGDYYVSWFVTVKTGLGTTGPNFALVTNETPTRFYQSTNAMKTGQLSGSAVIRATAGLTFRIVNVTGQPIVLVNDVPVSANISIIKAVQSLGGVQLQLTNLSGGSIDPASPVVFNETFADFSNSITNTDGQISFTAPGTYLVDWSVSIDGSLDATSIRFELIDSEEIPAVIGISESPLFLQSTTYGHVIISIAEATTDDPYIVQLINASVDESGTGAALTLSNIPLQASMRIAELN